ncbi:hypothetical protein KR084_003797 [Drosophila pseudotakahashii]|nr:hypothetical protein KR084_003797 [Drosophila pseudotakahashii]
MYDRILRQALPEGCTVVGPADDIAPVIVAKNLEEVTERCSLSIDTLMSWLAGNGLALAEHKTEAVLISSRKIVEKATIRVGSTSIVTSDSIKYLGVLIDHRLSFKSHPAYAAAKASRSTASISRMMTNTRGPKQHTRRIIATVATSTILYAASIWAEAMKSATYSRQCKAVYRRCALRITSSFCTVSEEAALVIAGTIPIDLLAAERRTGSTGSRTQRSNTIEAWQRRWTNADTGRWTHRLIPSLIPEKPIRERHGQVDYYLTQMISGHGCFKAYLHWFKHEPSPCCDHCGTASIEDAEHALFICPIYARNRAEAESKTERFLTVDNVINCMLENQRNWDAVANMAAGILKDLRLREQSRRNEP